MKKDRTKNLVGESFGGWVVKKRAPNNKNREIQWHCEHICGHKRIISQWKLKRGCVIRCVCGVRVNNIPKSTPEPIKKRRPSRGKEKEHGLSKTNIYHLWYYMKRKCESPLDFSYHNYGAKGITVCEEWSNSFPAYYEWAMLNGYPEKKYLDRIDPTKGFSPENCRLVDRAVTRQRRGKLIEDKMIGKKKIGVWTVVGVLKSDKNNKKYAIMECEHCKLRKHISFDTFRTNSNVGKSCPCQTLERKIKKMKDKFLEKVKITNQSAPWGFQENNGTLKVGVKTMWTTSIS